MLSKTYHPMKMWTLHFDEKEVQIFISDYQFISVYPLLINFCIVLGPKSSIWPCWHNVWTIWDSILEVFSCNTDWKGNYKNSHTGLCSSHYHILWYFGDSIAILLVVFFCTTSLFYPTPVMLFLVTCSANYLDICCFALLLYCYTLYVLQSIARKIKRRNSKEKEKEMKCLNFEIFVGEEIFLKASLYIYRSVIRFLLTPLCRLFSLFQSAIINSLTG